jgi:hypothetical protein
MKKMFLMAAFAAFTFAANAQTAATTDAAPAAAKKSSCCAAKTSCASMTKTECAKAMSEGKCSPAAAAAACHGDKAQKTSMAAKTEKADVKKVATNKP